MSESLDGLGPLGFMWSITPFCPNCKNEGYVGKEKMECEDGDECAGTSYGHFVCPKCGFRITVGIDDAGTIEDIINDWQVV